MNVKEMIAAAARGVSLDEVIDSALAGRPVLPLPIDEYEFIATSIDNINRVTEEMSKALKRGNKKAIAECADRLRDTFEMIGDSCEQASGETDK